MRTHKFELLRIGRQSDFHFATPNGKISRYGPFLKRLLVERSQSGDYPQPIYRAM
jgi:hypothetical protein